MVEKKAETEQELSHLRDNIKVTEDLRVTLNTQRENEAELLRQLSQKSRKKKAAFENLVDVCF